MVLQRLQRTLATPALGLQVLLVVMLAHQQLSLRRCF
jgi:hypothetical protein